LCISCRGVKFVDCRSKVSNRLNPSRTSRIFLPSSQPFLLLLPVQYPTWNDRDSLRFFFLPQRVLCEHNIENINSACQDEDDLRYLAYTTFDEPSGEHFCHVFVSDTPVREFKLPIPLNGLNSLKQRSPFCRWLYCSKLKWSTQNLVHCLIWNISSYWSLSNGRWIFFQVVPPKIYSLVLND
jgi:hypothetical protein